MEEAGKGKGLDGKEGLDEEKGLTAARPEDSQSAATTRDATDGKATRFARQFITVQ